MYKLFTNTDVAKNNIGHKILENMVIVFVAYTPPLAYPFVIGLPHLSVIYLLNTDGLSVVNYIPNILRPIYNSLSMRVVLSITVVWAVVVNTLISTVYITPILSSIPSILYPIIYPYRVH